MVSQQQQKLLPRFVHYQLLADGYDPKTVRNKVRICISLLLLLVSIKVQYFDTLKGSFIQKIVMLLI